MLSGAEIAKGDTLTFLDAHIECSPGWLEYLLYEVKKDRFHLINVKKNGEKSTDFHFLSSRTAVVCPIIDVINDDDFAYLTGSDMTWVRRRNSSGTKIIDDFRAVSIGD